jgi:hypothetical protein
MAEYVLARLAHGVTDSTIRGELTAVEQFLADAAVFAWEVEPAHADRFLGQAQRHAAPETRRGKAGAIDLFFRFLEARYRLNAAVTACGQRWRPWGYLTFTSWPSGRCRR